MRNVGKTMAIVPPTGRTVLQRKRAQLEMGRLEGTRDLRAELRTRRMLDNARQTGKTMTNIWYQENLLKHQRNMQHWWYRCWYWVRTTFNNFRYREKEYDESDE